MAAPVAAAAAAAAAVRRHMDCSQAMVVQTKIQRPRNIRLWGLYVESLCVWKEITRWAWLHCVSMLDMGTENLQAVFICGRG
jgi:hypothetical protein